MPKCPYGICSVVSVVCTWPAIAVILSDGAVVCTTVTYCNC